MVLTAILLSSMICAAHVIISGTRLEKGDGLGFVVSLIMGAVSAFITYTLFTFGG